MKTAADINAAILDAAVRRARRAGADENDLWKTWVTMHDDRVRPEHEVMHNRTIPYGETFTVAGHAMFMPGDLSAPDELICGCRCTLRTRRRSSLRAAANDQHDGMVIVALPAADDAVQGIGEEEKHLTLVWLGDSDEATADVEAIDEAVRLAARQMPPFEAGIKNTGELGDDGAWVAFLNEGAPVAIRDTLMDDSAIAEGATSVEQHPQYTPHVTLSYDTQPEVTGNVTFDRLALWVGDERSEYPLKGATPMDDDGDLTDITRVPWHGVLAPENQISGDRRKFSEGAMRHREFPLPLMYQDATAVGHDGSVRVANIQDLRRYESKIVGWGWMDTSENADEATRQIAEGMLRGVSVDVDDAEFSFEDEDGNALDGDGLMDANGPEPVMVITDGRISGATLCSIPAFQEAYVALGEPPTEWGFDLSELVASAMVFENVSDKPWSDFTQADYSDEQWKRACILDKGESAGEGKGRYGLPIREPSGTLNRNAVHAAAGRFNQVDAPPEAKSKAKAALRRAYGTLGEEPPEGVAATAMVEMVDDSGIPGHMPQKLKRYWTRGEGAAKIGWGTGGDFNRCRASLAKYVPPRMLAGLCANLHHDALGKWPGPGKSRAHSADVTPSPSICPCAMTASAAVADDFANPHLDRLTPLTIDGDRVFGHLAGWGTCHISFPDQCVTAPSSASGYAYFHTGAVLTADGSEMPVGHITMDTGHAAMGLSARPAAAHYDDTGAVVADVCAGDDEVGIWIAGRLRPGVTSEQKAALAAAALSGDWRRVGGSMEMVAALAVNVPGFPIPRTSAAMVAGAQTALVASGIVTTPGERQAALTVGATVKEIDGATVQDIAREIRAMERRRNRAEAVAASIGRDRVARRAAALALRGGQ